MTKAEGIQRSEGDVRKKWTYLKWEAKNTSKPGRDPVSKQVLNILTSRDREVQEAMNLRNLNDRFQEDGESSSFSFVLSSAAPSPSTGLKFRPLGLESHSKRNASGFRLYEN